MHILIIMLLLTTEATPVNVSTQEFNTLETCKAAGQEIEKQQNCSSTKSINHCYTQFKFICVAK